MAEDRKNLPTVAVPTAGYDLIAEFAASKRMSKGEAVRYLLQTSSELQEFAGRDDLSDLLSVNDWGGKRRGKLDDPDELTAGQIEAEILQSWQDAQVGNTRPLSQLWQALDEQ
jgi:hypothetical protein